MAAPPRATAFVRRHGIVGEQVRLLQQPCFPQPSHVCGRLGFVQAVTVPAMRLEHHFACDAVHMGARPAGENGFDGGRSARPAIAPAARAPEREHVGARRIVIAGPLVGRDGLSAMWAAKSWSVCRRRGQRELPDQVRRLAHSSQHRSLIVPLRRLCTSAGARCGCCARGKHPSRDLCRSRLG